MRKYELVTILDPQLSDDKKETINNQVVETVVKNEGKVINSQRWLDKYKMAFCIKKKAEGTYYLIKFEALSSAVDKIKRALKLNEDILRFGIFVENQ